MNFKSIIFFAIGFVPYIIFSQDVAWPGVDLGTISCPNTMSVSGSTTGATQHCTLSSAGDHTYQFTIVGPVDVTISTCTSGYDTEIRLFNLTNGNCNAGAIGTNDDGGACGGNTSLLIMTALASGTYVVVIEGWSGSEGDYDLDITTSNCPIPMNFVSATVSQPNTSSIENCMSNAELLMVDIDMTGNTDPLDLTSFDIATLGTTDNSEISSINVYYTGNVNTYSNSNLFGSLVSSTGGTVSGTQTLLEGNNYFWIEFMLNTPLVTTNIIDGTVTNVNVDGVNELTLSPSPGGSRTIIDCTPSVVASGAEQAWFTSELGVAGASPVTGWTNQGGNTSITTLTGGIGSVLNVNQPNFNFHDGVQNGGGTSKTRAFTQIFGPRANLFSNEITMFVVSDGGHDLNLSVHSHFGASGTQYNCFGFRHAGLGSLYGNGSSTNLYNGGATNGNMNVYGMRGETNGGGENTSNGFKSATAGSVGTFPTNNDDYEFSIGFWPGYTNSNNTTEVIVWNGKLNSTDFHIVESYLAIKYGVTLGTNGVSMDYNSSSNAVVWGAGVNSGYGFDIAGISGDSKYNLDQSKSHSVNGSSTTVFNDILTLVNGTNFASPASMADKTSFIWGHNNGATNNTGSYVNYPTDNNSDIIETIFERVWKGQETGAVNDVVLEFDMSAVGGIDYIAGNNDLSFLRLLVDEDGDFSDGATSYSPISYNNTTNIAYFQTDFTPTDGDNSTPHNGFFFTLGSTNASLTILPVQLVSFTGDCDKSLTWQTMSESDNDYFLIEKSYDGVNWNQVGKVNGNGTTSSVSNYYFKDTEDNSYLTYYKLKQIDFNGEINEISKIKVECENNKPIIYPNPFNDELFINFKTEGKYLVVVRDVLGRIIFNKEFVETNSNVEYLDLNQILPKGMYYVSIIQNERTILMNEKIVKN